MYYMAGDQEYTFILNISYGLSHSPVPVSYEMKGGRAAWLRDLGDESSIGTSTGRR